MKTEKQSNSILKELPDWYLTPNDFYKYMTEENQYLNGSICELDKIDYKFDYLGIQPKIDIIGTIRNAWVSGRYRALSDLINQLEDKYASMDSDGGRYRTAADVLKAMQND